METGPGNIEGLTVETGESEELIELFALVSDEVRDMPMRIGTEMPSLEGATEWIRGSAEEAASEANGQPTLVHFWSVSCGICKDNIPRVSQWREKFRDQGLRVIAIHMPRYASDVDVEAVRKAVADHKITENCAVDNDHKLRDSFKNEQGYVPAYYLFDAEGKLRSFAAGERGLDMLFSAINRVLATAAATKEASS
jgi:thiol-disulfide isomerase/thioredoxin